MATLKEFEEALREQGMTQALKVLEALRERDRRERKDAPARRVVGKRMTPELARRILQLHDTTRMTQQEIAFELGVNQGRVNEVIKRGKWLSGDKAAPAGPPLPPPAGGGRLLSGPGPVAVPMPEFGRALFLADPRL